MVRSLQRLGAEIVYTEDVNHGKRYGPVRVINPLYLKW
jgi:predicted nucleic acid-binding protein